MLWGELYLLQAIQYENQAVWVAASIFTFGLFGFAIYPIGLEMGVEATYPVAEATSTGIIIIVGFVAFDVALTTLSTIDYEARYCPKLRYFIAKNG